MTIKNKDHMPQIKRVTLVDAVVNQMVAAIKTGRFKAGDKIPSEKVLTQEFGVSRTTLREAFKKLELIGAISILQGNGTYLLDPESILEHESVQESNDNSLSEAIHNMFTLGDYPLTHYLEAREYLEIKCVELAIKRATDLEINTIGQYLEEHKDCVNNADEFVEFDLNFHKNIVLLSKNEFLYHFWISISTFIREQTQRAVKIPSMMENAYLAHTELYNAIKKRDKRTSKKLIIDHIRIIPGRFLSNIANQIDENKS